MAEDGRPSEPGPPIVVKAILLREGCNAAQSVWMWNPAIPDRLVVAFLHPNLDPPVAWNVGVELLEGDVLTGDMRLEYAGKVATLTLDGVDDGEDRIATMTGPAERFLDFHLDIQVAKSADHFERELRGLIDG